MEIASGITTHTIVLCVDKRERGMVLETLLRKKGFSVNTVFSLYEALKTIQQEMPHLIICDSILSDGTAGTIYDRIRQHSMLKNTPILVLVSKKTREQLTPLTGRKFAGFLLGQFDGASLLSKINEILSVNHDLSPYFVLFEDSEDMKSEFNISVDATVMGLSGDQIIYKSLTEIDGGAALVCVPQNSGYDPVLLKMGTNIVRGDSVFNLFPLSRVRGKGRRWIQGLPSIVIDSSSDLDNEKLWRVVFFDPNQKRFDQFKEVLLGYNIDLIHAPSIQKATQLMTRDARMLGCVYFHELTIAGTAVVREILAKIPKEDRPPIIVGTSSLNTRSTAEMRYIKKPFGLGVLVEMMEAAFKSTNDSVSEFEKTQDGVNFDCDYKAPARLVGLDETGGIIQLKFPVVIGNRLKLDHPFLERIWDGDVLAEITHVAALHNKPDIWQARFVAVSSKGNKVKYWQKIEKALSQLFSSRGESA